MASWGYSALKGELKLVSSQHWQHLQPCLWRGCLHPTPVPTFSGCAASPSPSTQGPCLLGPNPWGVASLSYSCTFCRMAHGEGRRPCHLAWAKPRPQLVGTLAPASPVRCSPPLLLSFLPSEGGKEKEEQPYEKNVNLLIMEYIAVHLKCCCYANTLGVYFLNPGAKRLVPRSPAELFEYVAAAAVSV